MAFLYLGIHNLELPKNIVGELIHSMKDHLIVAIGLSSTFGPIAVALDPSPLFFLGEHNNGGSLLLPYHPPEVICCIRQGTLGCNVGRTLVVAL